MDAHELSRFEPVRGRFDAEKWARIDPTIFVAKARQAQARAMADAMTAGWRAAGRLVRGAAGLLGRYLLEPLAKRSQRRQAIAALFAMDDRLLADIGLQRGDIELAVDGLLADPRVTPRAPAPQSRVPAADGDPTQPDKVLDLAA